MKRLLFVISLIIVASAFYIAEVKAKDSGTYINFSALDDIDGHIATKEEAKIILDQCSRSAPNSDKVTGYWQPEEAQLNELEQKFPEYYSKTKIPQAASEDVLSDFHRNYVGIILNGKKIIYIDFKPEGMKEISVICDGGPSFFGVEYNTESKTFSNLNFNGGG